MELIEPAKINIKQNLTSIDKIKPDLVNKFELDFRETIKEIVGEYP
jgi:hypothetical protein